MRLNMIPSVEMIRQGELKDKLVIIIDVLRATSVITTALASGAKCVVPVVEVEEALSRKEEGVLLGGERRAMAIEGFDLSNSPREYVKEVVAGRTIVLSTTNGTRSVHAALQEGAAKVVAGCMLNAKAVACDAVNWYGEVAILCAGTQGKFSLDDYICAGKLIHELIAETIGAGVALEMDDLSKAAYLAFEGCKKDVLGYVHNASHYQYLLSIGLEQDIQYCFQQDRFHVVPRIVFDPSGRNETSEFVFTAG